MHQSIIRSLTIFSTLCVVHSNLAFPSAGLSIEYKIGQMLLILAHTAESENYGYEYQLIKQQLQKDDVGSIDLALHMDGPNLMRYKPGEVMSTFNAYQRATKYPLLISADIERGLIARVADAPDMPNIMAYGAAGYPAQARRLGEITAREARAVGIQWYPSEQPHG